MNPISGSNTGGTITFLDKGADRPEPSFLSRVSERINQTIDDGRASPVLIVLTMALSISMTTVISLGAEARAGTLATAGVIAGGAGGVSFGQLASGREFAGRVKGIAAGLLAGAAAGVAAGPVGGAIGEVVWDALGANPVHKVFVKALLGGIVAGGAGVFTGACAGRFVVELTEKKSDEAAPLV